MRYTDTEAAHPFDTDNRAWRHFAEVTSEHFDLVTWTRPDGRPILMSVCDLATGDVFTVAEVTGIDCTPSERATITTRFEAAGRSGPHTSKY